AGVFFAGVFFPGALRPAFTLAFGLGAALRFDLALTLALTFARDLAFGFAAALRLADTLRLAGVLRFGVAPRLPAAFLRAGAFFAAAFFFGATLRFPVALRFALLAVFFFRATAITPLPSLLENRRLARRRSLSQDPRMLRRPAAPKLDTLGDAARRLRAGAEPGDERHVETGNRHMDHQVLPHIGDDLHPP